MALDDTVVGANATPQQITWQRTDGTAQNLTGFTITAKMYSIERRTSKAVTGTFSDVTPASGIFQWNRSAADVDTEGVWLVQFKGTNGSNVTITFDVVWHIRPAR
jgi:hypothetical protein